MEEFLGRPKIDRTKLLINGLQSDETESKTARTN
jgi:hypothetical protein